MTTGPSGADGRPRPTPDGCLPMRYMNGPARGSAKRVPRTSQPARAECAWCPICQLIAALRGERPDMTDKLAAAAAAVVDVVGSLLNPPPGRTSGPADDPPGTGTDAGSGKR